MSLTAETGKITIKEYLGRRCPPLNTEKKELPLWGINVK